MIRFLCPVKLDMAGCGRQTIQLSGKGETKHHEFAQITVKILDSNRLLMEEPDGFQCSDLICLIDILPSLKGGDSYERG